MEKKDLIVVSGVNLVNGGALSVFKDCLGYLANELANQYDIVAIVHDKNLIGIDGIKYLEFPRSKKRWINRIYYEYIYFKKLSRELTPYLWFSIHDITPNVQSQRRAVYCHNTLPFYKFSVRELWLNPELAIFNAVYGYFYGKNIEKNDYVIVQQQWLREKFKKLFGLYDNVIVAYPAVDNICLPNKTAKRGNCKTVFIYPCLPRVFKNFELICEASKILCRKGIKDFEVILTINGTESRYSRWVFNKYGDMPLINFVGLQPREKVFEYYSQADAMIFPSKLESWGMPITEFIQYDKPVLLADLGYARETVGTYNKAKFFDPENPSDLAKLMEDFLNGSITYESPSDVKVESPFAANWKELFDILLSNNG